jgi:hypothetical protein
MLSVDSLRELAAKMANLASMARHRLQLPVLWTSGATGSTLIPKMGRGESPEPLLPLFLGWFVAIGLVCYIVILLTAVHAT